MSEEKRLGIREARTQLGRLVDEAHYRGETTVITKNDEPRAVLVPYDWYVGQQETAASTGDG
ncbi:type II toxin-antitoxin system Phd/YefM family antitoxin [Streptomyces sp. NPDC003395]